MSDRDLPFRYRVVSEGERLHHVVVVHNDTPDWWRLVATFGVKDRADCYCEVENDIAEEEDATRDDSWRRDDCGPAPAALPPPPATRVTADNFRPPSPAEKARVGAALIEDAGRETGESLQIEAKPEAPKKKPQGRQPMASEEAARRDDNLLAAIAAILADGREPMWGEMAERAGIPKGSLGYALERLENQGKIERKDGFKISAEPRPPRADDVVGDWLAKNRGGSLAVETDIEEPDRPSKPSRAAIMAGENGGADDPRDGQLIHAVSQFYRNKQVPSWADLAKAAGFDVGQMPTVLARLANAARLTRDEYGVRPRGMPPLKKADEREMTTHH